MRPIRRQVCAGLPPRHSLRPVVAGRFQGIEYRSSPLPDRPQFPGSASSLTRLTRKGLTPRSSLSFSLAAILRGTPDAVWRARFRMSPSGSSRRGLVLNEPDGPCTRLVPHLRDFGPESHRGIRKSPSAPTLNRTARGRLRAAEHVPFARLPNLGCLWDRIRRLPLALGQGLLPKASLELEEPLSWRIQLYGSFA